MVQCDKEEALKAREIAIKKMEANDFVAARKIVLEAQKLYPELDCISHMLAVCDVHCAAEASVKGVMDWYKIFQLEEAADKSIIRKKYLKLTHSLHTDRNRFPGAEAAFKLVAEAYSVLYESTKRFKYDIKTGRNLFGTKCPHCQKEYKCHFLILNKMVHCKECRRNFIASVNQYVVSGFVEGNPSINVARHNGEKKAEQSVMSHEVVGTAMTNNNTGGGSMPNLADPNIVRVNLASEETSNVPSAAVETSKRNQDADGNTMLNSDSNKRQRKNDSLSAHVDTSCKQISDDIVISVDRQQPAPTHMSREGNIKEKAKTTGTGDQGRDISCEQDTTLQKNAQGANQLSDKHLSPNIYTYPDPEFHRFEEDRSCEKFERGQIWALYDDVDTFPRLYGWITKVEPEPFTVHLIWLEVYPQQEQEKRWLEQEISISCGTFRVLDRRAQYGTTYTFSHLVDVRETRIPSQVKILPEVGEVWAVYMNWAPGWTPSSINACEFAVAEVTERTEASTKLWFLSKVDGYVSVFKPNEDEENGVLEIPARENLRFSHRIPCFFLTGERGRELCGFYELDPAAVPFGFIRKDTT